MTRPSTHIGQEDTRSTGATVGVEAVVTVGLEAVVTVGLEAVVTAAF
jgi:hypothetical protein